MPPGAALTLVEDAHRSIHRPAPVAEANSTRQARIGRHLAAWFSDPEKQNRELVAFCLPLFDALEAIAAGRGSAGRAEIARVIRELARTKAMLEGKQLGQVSLRDVERAVRAAEGSLGTALELIAARSARRESVRRLRNCEQHLARLRTRDAVFFSASPVARSRGHAPRRGSNTRCRGSRRTTGTSTSRGDPGDGDPEPEPVGPRPRTCRQTQRGQHRDGRQAGGHEPGR